MAKAAGQSIYFDDDGGVDIPAGKLEIASVAVTSTAAELNILDGVTSTAAELNILDGVTSTAAELNKLDGYTGTAAELNMAADSSANVEVVTGANTITAAESGKTFFLNSATGFASTLPAKAAGLRFTFILGATQNTSGNHTIVPNASDDDTIQGEVVVAGATVPGVDEGSINFVASTTLPGDRVDLINDGTNWYVQGTASASGAITLTT